MMGKKIEEGILERYSVFERSHFKISLKIIKIYQILDSEIFEDLNIKLIEDKDN